MSKNPYKIDGPAILSISGGRTSGFMLRQILDTHVDGGEGEPLIVASFFDRGEAEFFCRAGNREWRRCSVSPKPDSDPALIEAAERAERYEKALQSIAEYWNGSPNDSAMLDACQRNADYAKQVLEGATP